MAEGDGIRATISRIENINRLARWPLLVTQPVKDWPVLAKHLEDAAHARERGEPCPWCPVPAPSPRAGRRGRR